MTTNAINLRRFGGRTFSLLIAILINIMIFIVGPFMLHGVDISDIQLSGKTALVFSNPNDDVERSSDELKRDQIEQPQTDMETPQPEIPDIPQPELDLDLKPEIMEAPSPPVAPSPVKTVEKKQEKKVAAAKPVKEPAVSESASGSPGFQEKGQYSIGEVDSKPVTISRSQPRYPVLARRRNIEGWVKIRFLVDKNGSVRALSIVDSEPRGVFDQSVLDTVPKWLFKPGIVKGRPVNTWVATTVKFRLR